MNIPLCNRNLSIAAFFSECSRYNTNPAGSSAIPFGREEAADTGVKNGAVYVFQPGAIPALLLTQNREDVC
ncbi:MAG: hypothetical protein JXA44_13355 [Methanospirillaceae archaeon]|nr:hypothetical protein [Methanospirillaceae archaeon]